MTKAYLIDVTAKTVTQVEYEGLQDMHALIGGYIEAAARFPNGDVLYVDEEGMLKTPPGYFLFVPRPDQPLASNGLLVGQERCDEEGEYIGVDDPKLSLEQLKLMVRFVDRHYVDSWGKGNASEPASTITTFNPDGTSQREVLTTWGQVIGGLPKPESEEEGKP